jgi:hypothetical protein
LKKKTKKQKTKKTNQTNRIKFKLKTLFLSSYYRVLSPLTMSFFKKFSKQKVPFHFYIFVSNMSNLPLHVEGSSLLAQIKRKDKSSQTKYAHVSNRTVTWEESMHFSTSLWGKNLGKPDVHFDEKRFTIKIKSLTSDRDLMDFDLDLSQFVKENSFLEHQHSIVFPPDFNFEDEDDIGIKYAHQPHRGSQQPPRMNIVIRSYADGLNHARGNDFSQFHNTGSFKNPLHSTVSVVVNDINTKLEPNRHYGDNDEDGLMPDPDQIHSGNKERRGTRKISVMFNEVTGNGHRQSCLPTDKDHNTRKEQRQSTYRFSIAAGKGMAQPIDSSDESDGGISKKNTFDEPDPFDDDDDDDDDDIRIGGSNNRGRLMSLAGNQQQNHFDIGEDSDYE